jgi:hypothetical protein
VGVLDRGLFILVFLGDDLDLIVEVCVVGLVPLLLLLVVALEVLAPLLYQHQLLLVLLLQLAVLSLAILKLLLEFPQPELQGLAVLR